MDMGTYEQATEYVIPVIEKLGIKEISVYFSHMHIDHYGARPDKLVCGLDAIHDIGGLKIKNLYLPDNSLGTQNSDYVDKYGKFVATKESTNIFIYPGYKYEAIDALITNFHLPKSTLIMLVSALAGKEFILKAYNEAVKEKYRFFSFGDAMFIHE